MINITHLAQREKFEAWVMTQICISKSTLEGLRSADGYRNSMLSGTNYNRMWNCWKAAGAELVEALEKAQQRIDELENDEVRQRLANAEHQLHMAELAKNNLRASRKAQFRKRKAAEQRIAELESRTVTVKQFDEFQICHYGATEDYAKGYIDCQNNFFKWLTAAGIKWGDE